MPRVILHQWEMSPFCNKARRCLKLKDIAFEVVNYNGLLARNASGLSAAGKLPVLDWDGERIPDSTAIARFLDRQVPTPRLYPEDPEELARVRFWEDWAGQSLLFYEIYFRMLDPVARERALDLLCKGRPAWERKVLDVVLRLRYPRKMKAQGLGAYPRAQVEQQFFELLDSLEVLLGRRPFLVGSSCTIADLSVAAQLDEIMRTSDLDPRIRERTQVQAWLQRF